MTCAVDLRPFYGILEQRKNAYLVKPDRGILKRCIADLDAADARTRLRAAEQLRYFPEDAEAVVPILVALIGDADARIREQALISLHSYPKQAAAHFEIYIRVAKGGGRITRIERAQATMLLAWIGPKDERVEKTLRDLAATKDGFLGQLAPHALLTYLDRTSD